MSTYLFTHILNSLALAGPSAPTAYIDPSTGGMLFQVLAVIFALFSGMLFFFSRQIRSGIARIRRALRGETEPAEEVQTADQDQEQE